MSVRILHRYPAHALLWASLLLLLALVPSRAMADRARARCTGVEIKGGEAAILKQAERQHLAADAHGVSVEWHIAEGRLVRFMRQVVRDKGWLIKVIHTPRSP
jgi:hypothetical protein